MLQVSNNIIATFNVGKFFQLCSTELCNTPAPGDSKRFCWTIFNSISFFSIPIFQFNIHMLCHPSSRWFKALLLDTVQWTADPLRAFNFLLISILANFELSFAARSPIQSPMLDSQPIASFPRSVDRPQSLFYFVPQPSRIGYRSAHFLFLFLLVLT